MSQMALRKLFVPFFSEAAAARLVGSSRSMSSSASLRHVDVDPPSSERPVRPIPAFDPQCAPNGEELMKIISDIKAVNWTKFEKEALQDEVLKATGGMDMHLIVSGLNSGRFTISEYMYLGLELNKRFPHLSSLLEIELNGKTALIPRSIIEALEKEPQLTRIEFTQRHIDCEIQRISVRLDSVVEELQEVRQNKPKDWTSVIYKERTFNWLAALGLLTPFNEWLLR